MLLLAALDRWLACILRSLVIAALAVTLVLITLGVVARIVPVFSMSGYDEVIEFLIAWMTFAGTIALWREGLLFKIDFISFLQLGSVTKAASIFAHVLILTFAVVFTWKGWQFASESIETMPFLFVSKIPWYASMPVCGLFMSIYAVVDLVRVVLGWPAPSVASPEGQNNELH